MPIVIKKQIPLDVIGEGFANISPTFRVIPVSDILKINKRINEAGEDSDILMGIFLDVIGEYFIEDDMLKKDDLDSLGSDAVLHCFRLLTGQDPDPKFATPSTTPSETEVTI